MFRDNETAIAYNAGWLNNYDAACRKLGGHAGPQYLQCEGLGAITSGHAGWISVTYSVIELSDQLIQLGGYGRCQDFLNRSSLGVDVRFSNSLFYFRQT